MKEQKARAIGIFMTNLHSFLTEYVFSFVFIFRHRTPTSFKERMRGKIYKWKPGNSWLIGQLKVIKTR